MNLESHEAARDIAPRIISIAKREREICEASKAAETAFGQIADAASPGLGVNGDLQDRVYSIFRWYFLSAFCTRMLTESRHRLEHQTLQVTMDIYSAVRMAMSKTDIERSMALVSTERTSPTQVRVNDIGGRGHSVGWIAAGLHEQGRGFPGEIKNSLAGALAALKRLH
ncbi:hypothetical protein [Ruegeria halocynthiae]|uniref:hypothetical protein n=1 Tax=Ruegeria halocynthiae TaxID=985054 RepID=UPI000562DF13|nr:hypothetical protein [Ruegeria halocynthiae]